MAGNFSSVYARRVFYVPTPATLTALMLRVDYDDGFVAYLKGTEVARSNVVGSPPAFDALAISPHEASGGNVDPNPPEDFDLTGFVDLLVPGVNVLAIQAHNVTLNDGDFSLIAELYPGDGLSRGDLNCDGTVDSADINPFVLALSGQSAYEARYRTCNWLNADCNGDGVVSYADINPFVHLLAGGG